MENSQDILNEALDSINNEDYNTAQTLLKKAALIDKNNKEIYKNLGLCEVNLDNPMGAIEAFLEALNIDNKDALSLFYLASCYNRTGQKDIAINNFKKVIELRPDYVDAYKNLAMIYIELSQTDNAIEIIKQAIDNVSMELDYSIYYIIATAYMLKKDNENSIIYLEKALELNPEHIPIMNSLAVCYMNSNKAEKALPILKKAFELDNKNSLSAYNLGIYYQTALDFKEALKYLQIAYELEPSITMLATLANCAMEAGQIALASTLYQNLVITYPNNTQYRYAYTNTLEALQKYDEALNNIDMLLSLDEKNIDYIKKRGTYLRKLGRYEESTDEFTILLNRGKIDVEVYYNLAFNYVESGDYDNAKEMFKKCIMLEPNNPYAHKDLGVLYLKMNCYDWAVDEMQEAIKLENNVAEFHYSLGVAYLMLSKIDEAKQAFENALKIDSNEPDCLAYLGYIYILDRNYEKAFEFLQKAITIDSNNFLAKSHLAKYYFQVQKYDTAKEFLKDLAEKTKDDETMNMLAISYLKTDEFENAMGIFYKLAQKYPNNHILLTDLARCELKCNKQSEAMEHLRQALMIFDDYPEALDLLEEINCGK